MGLVDFGVILKLSLSLEIPRGPRTGSSRGPCIARLSTEPVLAIHYIHPISHYAPSLPRSSGHVYERTTVYYSDGVQGIDYKLYSIIFSFEDVE